MNTRLLFKASAIVEVLTRLALLVARVLVIGLLSVGVAGWDSQGQEIRLAPRAGLCTYNVGAAIVFVILGMYGGMNGILLWPAAVLQASIGALMLWVILAPSQLQDGRSPKVFG